MVPPLENDNSDEDSGDKSVEVLSMTYQAVCYNSKRNLLIIWVQTHIMQAKDQNLTKTRCRILQEWKEKTRYLTGTAILMLLIRCDAAVLDSTLPSKKKKDYA